MKLPKHEFKKLQKQWYKILKDSGFNDIEREKDEQLVLTQTAAYPFRNTDEFLRIIKEEYFRCMSQKALDENTVFRNEIDKYILLRHSEGAKIKIIGEELVSRGTSRDRKSIRIIIRRYEMAWGIRFYGPRELNLKVRA
jgi:hypothetical protein